MLTPPEEIGDYTLHLFLSWLRQHHDPPETYTMALVRAYEWLCERYPDAPAGTLPTSAEALAEAFTDHQNL